MSGGRLMTAIRVSEFGAPSVLQVCSEVGIPQPGPRQVLIRVHACGVNPVETYIRAGWYPRKPTLPYTPGTDAAGVVESIGEGVTAVKAGDRVFTTATVSGGYAEYAVADDDCVYQLPEALDFAQGSAIGIPYFTAYRAVVQKAHIKPGETILVHGASGGVGVAVCQLSRALGLRVLGTAGTPEGMKLALNNGAHQAFNHREEDYTHKVMEQTSGRGVDVVVDMLSNVNLSKDLQMLASGGRVVGTAVLPQICALSQSWKVWQQIPLETISGLIRSIRRNVTFIEILVVGSRGSTEINPRDIMAKESSIVGVALTFAKPEERKECAAYLFAGMEAGWLRPVVGSQYPLEQAAQAHHDIIESPGAAGKIVLTL